MRLRNAIVHGLVHSGIMGKVLGKRYEKPKILYTSCRYWIRVYNLKGEFLGLRAKDNLKADFEYSNSKVVDVGDNKLYVFDRKSNEECKV